MTVTQTPSGGLQSQGPAASMSSDNTGLIVGTTVGGIAFIGIVATLLFFVFRWNTKRDRRRKIQDEFDLGGQGMYDPGYHRDASGDMDEVDHFTPYPFIAPMSYGTNAWDVDHGWNNGRFEDPRATGNAGVPTLPSNGSFPLFPSPSLPYPVASEMSSLPYPVASEMSSLPYPASTTLPPTRAATRDTSFPPQPESMRRTATTTALAAAAGRENKAEAERRRTRSFHQARPSDSVLRPGPPVQAEDGGFVADGGEIPPVYRHEWEAQRQRLNHGAVL
ncbi:uncharacterized protein CcaverHIS019_0312350 [Cutaneotrichosporon cavernicola]|uniref:Uncharacterized protein n=1 Tax=Cutaneotrichosporon cavernicola TaxID=279322 RepID=A0AA48L3B2_9TREE|nr:uncharacterized protein CcaverHIS019_0312350 [Cutaneotrichosporon cavernicola]BEI91165.1 hypothetical protein CcaverHIS019_0312350 [Cutaneotrichosporon cavernicola]BEI98942.1 hypothetical protein CcaverHIS631_0312410 [Cutaneotrichosporon cavernicola]BEJ06716.1 hypothetical protein CcaverHIS641_0312380 [Cutaneotrichosporon cavernicola]